MVYFRNFVFSILYALGMGVIVSMFIGVLVGIVIPYIYKGYVIYEKLVDAAFDRAIALIKSIYPKKKRRLD